MKKHLIASDKAVNCVFCKGDNTSLIIDFGRVALAGAFLKPEGFKEEIKYPLKLYLCRDCYMLQISEPIDPAILFKNYFYFSSSIQTLKDHFQEYAKEIKNRFLTKPHSSVLEIGCNDGILLKPLADLGITTVIGVDPATNVIKTISDPRIHIFNNFFSSELSSLIKKEFGPIDVIVANNVFAHLKEIVDVAKGIYQLLSDKGVFIFEVHYVRNLIEHLQYDMIYHEHLYYYSLIALEKFFSSLNMEIFDIKFIANHGGSARYYVRKKTNGEVVPISVNVTNVQKDELNSGYNRLETFLDYADKVANSKRCLMSLISSLISNGKKIYGYGASGRANTIIQYCGINNSHLPCIIDDAPYKQGFYTPGSHIVIKSRKILEYDFPDYILVFA